MSEKTVQLNEEVIKGQIKELVRGSVEETLNELLEKEAELVCARLRHAAGTQRGCKKYMNMKHLDVIEQDLLVGGVAVGSRSVKGKTSGCCRP